MEIPGEGHWCHVEIPAADVQRSRDCYTAVFNWKFTQVPHDYTLYETGGSIGGGLMKKPDPMPQQLINYVNVGEIEPYLEKIESNGGSVIQPITEIPNTGWLAIVADPDGNAFGLWKQNPNAHH